MVARPSRHRSAPRSSKSECFEAGRRDGERNYVEKRPLSCPGGCCDATADLGTDRKIGKSPEATRSVEISWENAAGRAGRSHPAASWELPRASRLFRPDRGGEWHLPGCPHPFGFYLTLCFWDAYNRVCIPKSPQTTSIRPRFSSADLLLEDERPRRTGSGRITNERRTALIVYGTLRAGKQRS
jgi:hypothetical protein